jgi:hypothetical protein
MDFQDGGVPHETPVGAQRTYRVQFREERRARGFGGCFGARRACDPVGFLKVPPLPPLRTQYASAMTRFSACSM